LNTSIVICGQKFDIGTRVVLWNEKNGLNGYDQSKVVVYEEDRKTGKKIAKTISGKRYGSRTLQKLNLSGLQNVVTQFFLHHSGLYHSSTTFNVLHNERKLSVHFILDDDGTLYQTLDLVECAWHGGKNNKCSVGIEIDSRAMANQKPDAYDEYNQKKYNVLPRNKVLDNIHGNWITGYDYNDNQYKTLIRLGKVLMEAFPKMNKNVSGTMVADFPRDSDGKIEKKMIINPTSHCGFICHYHVSENKVDPISFDYNRFLLGIYKNNPDQKPLENIDGDDKEKYFKKLNFKFSSPTFIVRPEKIMPLK
jgi:hypothetical protein